MIYLYNAILVVFFVPASLLLLVRHRKRVDGAFFKSIGERLGRWDVPPAARPGGKPLLWVHCASLGEVKAVEPLLKKLGSYSLLLTTITSSGREYAQANDLAAHIRYVPLDFSFIAGAVMKRLRPRALLLVETELWPGLIHAAAKNGVPVILVNGRLSKRSYPYYRALAPFWRKVFSGIGRVCARYREDAERFAAIGAPEGRISVTGNIKYDQDFPGQTVPRTDFGYRDTDLIWVCGSTREGEERIILDAWEKAKARHPALKLVIAPRHINRAGALADLLAGRGHASARRSAPSNKPFDCLIVDTFGELSAFYALADITLVGGSLVDKGGQNPVEPAACAKPVLFGPSTDNFASEARLLEESGGGIRVHNAEELAVVVGRLIADPSARAEVGRAARAAVQGQRGALDRTLREIAVLVRD